METMQSMESHYTLCVDTVNGRPLVARIVRYGEKFGPNGSYENHNGMPIVEIRRADVSPRISYLSAFNAELFEALDTSVRWSPDGTLQNALPVQQVEKLVRWLEEQGVISGLV
jgi:hypothetical protein